MVFKGLSANLDGLGDLGKVQVRDFHKPRAVDSPKSVSANASRGSGLKPRPTHVANVGRQSLRQSHQSVTGYI
jgi:hypothetical protein